MNAQQEPSGTPGAALSTHPAKEPTWSERAGAWLTKAGKTSLIAIIVAAIVLVLYWIAAAVLPRWWSQFIGARVNGDMSAGAGWGFTIGFLFSFVPTLVIAQAARPIFKNWKAKAIVVGIGLLLALPNWLTLWVVLGTNDAAHAAERTFDVDAPFFRGWSLAGAIVGVVVALFIVIMLAALKKRRASYKEREANLKAREQELDSRSERATSAEPAAPTTDDADRLP